MKRPIILLRATFSPSITPPNQKCGYSWQMDGCFHNASTGGRITAIVAPWPGMETVPTFVQQYERCSWRGEDMTLLEYLRKSNTKGDIIDWVKNLGSIASLVFIVGSAT